MNNFWFDDPLAMRPELGMTESELLDLAGFHKVVDVEYTEITSGPITGDAPVLDTILVTRSRPCRVLQDSLLKNNPFFK